MKTSRVSPADEGALLDLFAACGSSCFCRYWHFTGDKNEWLDRCANRPDESRAELTAELTSADPDAYGVVARDEGTIVGWLKLVRPLRAPKIVEQRYYRSLPCLAEGRGSTLVIGCMLVRPSHRRRGVARALIREAIAVARTLGADAVMALPRATSEPVSDGELWLGPLGAFAGLGFREVHDERPYPVLRLDLREAAP